MPAKKRPPRNAYERQLQADWEAALAKHAKPLEKGAVAKGVSVDLTEALARKVPPLTKGVRPDADLMKHKSHATQGDNVAGKRYNPKYTGSAILAMGSMHKSNTTPLFSPEAVQEVASMKYDKHYKGNS